MIQQDTTNPGLSESELCCSPEEVLAELDRVLQSRGFREAHQLQAFLKHVVTETLAGREDGLKEYLVGSSVFARRYDYDPRRDGIVRVQATVLRKRLETWYRGEGVQSEVVIELPRGGYVPVFRKRSVAPAGTPAPVEIAVPVVIPRRRIARSWRAFALGCAAVAAIWAGSAFFAHRSGMTARAAVEFPEFWQPIIEPASTTIVGFGVPLFFGGGGIYIRDVRVNASTPENDRRIAEETASLGIQPTPSDDLYTGVGEAAGMHLVSDFLVRRGMNVRVANARTLGLSELRDRNLIIVSSLRFRTLLSELRLPSDFDFVGSESDGKPDSVLNRRPAAGERERYEFRDGAGVSTSYALVSVWPSLDMRHRIVHIGGVHTWATQAATEFLLAPEHLRQIAREFARDRATGRRGPVSPFFQIVLRVEARGNQFQTVNYVTHHYLPIDKPPVTP